MEKDTDYVNIINFKFQYEKNILIINVFCIMEVRPLMETTFILKYRKKK